MMKLVVLLALFGLVSTNILGRAQSAGVRGRLMCDGRPASGVKVKLYDEDDGGIDDKMAEGKTNSNGEFNLSGHTSEITPIDPKINIYHDCNDGWKPCQRKFTIKIPNNYITQGKSPSKFYDAGTIQLAGSFPGESRDCIN